MKKLALAAIAAAMMTVTATGTVLPATAHAQEMREVSFYKIQMIRWKPGKTERAHEIIALFMATEKALGRNDVSDFHMETGVWNSIVVIKMRGGIAEMGMKNIPDEMEWDKKFAELNGGEEKAKALYAEFEDCIETSETQIAHLDKAK